MTTMLEVTRDRMVRAREAMASDVFAWEKIIDTIGNASAMGDESVTIAPKYAVDLAQTTTATDTMAKLREFGFDVRWTRSRVRPDAPDVPALEIRWTIPAPGIATPA
jgi:hypothetical protein